MKIILPFCLILIFSFSSIAQKINKPLPKVWMTYYDGSNLEEDFKDMKNHGVDAIEVGIWGIEGNSRASEVLQVARQTDMKLIIGIPEISEQAFKFPKNKVERAVMMGGAFNGKAIDRFRFAFTPEKHTITIESPVYYSTNCYGNIGRYFMGLKPVNAEVVVKLADYDGKQHLKIIPAKITPQKENFWNMKFDLTDVKGDLENVVLAVFWTSEGTRDHWIFGDAVSLYSEGFKSQLQHEVKKVISAWKDANNGIFPSEIIAIRYGDECFHISGHLNSEDCSYPVWDYSESAIKKFWETFNEEYPRGVGWTDMYGREANARWMYNFHEAAANSVKLVKECLRKEGVDSLPVFRNITRMNVFDLMNDFDGSGLEMLAKELDILQIDPYPVSDKGYIEKIIPRDMTYLEGLARRFNKPLVPWMQAHVYGNLKHPTPEHIAEMMKQQKQFNINSLMWLGYGYNNSGNTFPKKNTKSWQQAKQEHALFRDNKTTIHKPDFAVIRPYTVGSLSGIKDNTADNRFLTDVLLEKAVFQFNLRYDPFEPLSCETLQSNDLQKYPLLIAEIGILNAKTLRPFILSEVPAILIIAGAEFDKQSLKMCGIKKIAPGHKNNATAIKEDFKIVLNNKVEILYQINNQPVAWRKDGIIFIGHLPINNLNDLAIMLLKEISRH
jgi:hypothetical protein